MIEAGLEYPPSARRAVIEALLSLPDALRPTRESAEEDSEGIEIVDQDKFINAVMKRETGLMLKGRDVLFDVSFAGEKDIRCNCFLNVIPDLVKVFMIHMAAAHPIFGFACAREELERRNRVTIKQDMNTIESWVGRDTQKYIPGIYWWTLLPSSLVEKHKIDLSMLATLSLEHIELEGQQHLFRLYEKPQDWSSSTVMAQLYSSSPGIFDVKKVRSQLEAAKNFLELNAVTSNWR